MIYLVIGLSVVEKISGLFLTYFGVLMVIPALMFIAATAKTYSISKPFHILFFLIPFSFLSGIEYGLKVEIILRSIQFSVLILAFCYIAIYLDPLKLKTVFSILVYVMIACFCFELIVKPDLLGAYLNLDLEYFLKSGGAYLYDETRGRSSGLTLFAQGNVYAATIAGLCFIVCLISKKPFLAITSLFFAISTGSRALLVSFFAILVFSYIYRYHSRFWIFSIRAFVLVLILQPLIYQNLYWLFSDELNDFLYSLSPRYVAFIAHAHMGLDHIFGVGLFQASSFSEYFFARWPIPAHNQFMSFFGELGIMAYFIWCSFLWQFTKTIEKNYHASVVFIFTLSMYTFITGYNEWSFWVPLALSYAIARGGSPIKKFNTSLQ